jgi:Ca-activated chloride channel family protein
MLLIPLVLVALLIALSRRRPTLIVSTIEAYKSTTLRIGKLFSPIRLPLILEAVGALLIIVALIRPQFGIEETVTRTEGIDIMLALDVSGSMQAVDVPKHLGVGVREQRNIRKQRAAQQRITKYLNSNKARQRIVVAKDEVKAFIERRPNDRIGIIAFASHAYTVCPPTLDHPFLQSNLEQLDAGMFMDQQTGIAEPVANCTSRLKGSDAQRRVMVLFTDGANNIEAQIKPEQAATIANMFDITMYTVGIGSELAYANVRRRWQHQPANFDPKLLETMAATTGGLHFRAEDSKALQEVMAQIDELETIDFEQPKFVDYKDLYSAWLYAGILVILLALLFENTVSLKVP